LIFLSTLLFNTALMGRITTSVGAEAPEAHAQARASREDGHSIAASRDRRSISHYAPSAPRHQTPYFDMPLSVVCPPCLISAPLQPGISAQGADDFSEFD
jgi:hypothetical protein